jgi:hypothetical protein
MGTYKDVSTVLDAYHQLERGRNVARMKAAANRLRSVDSANEILSELEAKIGAMECVTEGIAFSPFRHRKHHTAEVLV